MILDNGTTQNELYTTIEQLCKTCASIAVGAGVSSRTQTTVLVG